MAANPKSRSRRIDVRVTDAQDAVVREAADLAASLDEPGVAVSELVELFDLPRLPQK